MSTYADVVRASLSQLAEEEIVNRLRIGGVTSEARRIAEEILAARGVSFPPSVEPVQPRTGSDATRSGGSDPPSLPPCYQGESFFIDPFLVL